jgi:hypothetical protein
VGEEAESGGVSVGTIGLSALWYVAKRLIVLVALAVAVSPWVLVAQKLRHPPQITQRPGQIQPSAIVWDNRVFSSRAVLASWLTSRGASYHQWARLHQLDAAIVEHRPAPALSASKHLAIRAHPTFSSQAEGVTGRSRAPRGRSMQAPATPFRAGASIDWARIVLLAVALLTMLTAVIPAALGQLPGSDWFSATRRTYVFAFGLSTCVGVLVAGVHL